MALPWSPLNLFLFPEEFVNLSACGEKCTDSIDLGVVGIRVSGRGSDRLHVTEEAVLADARSHAIPCLENGGFPLDLARTKPYGYSIFQLDNMVTLCHVLSTLGDDLWKRLSPDPLDAEIHRNIAITQPLLWLEWQPMKSQ